MQPLTIEEELHELRTLVGRVEFLEPGEVSRLIMKKLPHYNVSCVKLPFYASRYNAHKDSCGVFVLDGEHRTYFVKIETYSAYSSGILWFFGTAVQVKMETKEVKRWIEVRSSRKNS